jgi:hypothetical protein
VKIKCHYFEMRLVRLLLRRATLLFIETVLNSEKTSPDARILILMQTSQCIVMFFLVCHQLNCTRLQLRTWLVVCHSKFI